jgi:hypothetical protein
MNAAHCWNGGPVVGAGGKLFPTAAEGNALASKGFQDPPRGHGQQEGRRERCCSLGQQAGVTGATATMMLVRGLVERDALARLQMTPQGREVFKVLIEG